MNKDLIYNIPKIKCLRHPSYNLNHFCLEDLCIHSVLCPSCLQDHNIEHKTCSFKTIFKTEREQLMKKLSDSFSMENLEESLLIPVLEKFKKCKSMIVNILEEIESELFHLKQCWISSKLHYSSAIKSILQLIGSISDISNTELILRKITQEYKLIKSIEILHNFDPEISLKEFFEEFSFRTNQLSRLQMTLKNCYTRKFEDFSNFKEVTKGTIPNMSRILPKGYDISRKGLVALSYDSVHFNPSPLVLGQISTSSSTEFFSQICHFEGPLNKVQFISEDDLLVNSYRKIAILKIKSPMETKVTSTYPYPPNLLGIFYSKLENLIFGYGKNPHCLILKIRKSKIYLVKKIHSNSNQGDSCTVVEYIDSMNCLALGFEKNLELRNIYNNNIIVNLRLSSPCSFLTFLNSRDFLLVGLRECAIEFYKIQGSRSFKKISNVSISQKNKYVSKATPTSVAYGDGQTQLIIATGQKYLKVLDLEAPERDIEVELSSYSSGVVYHSKSQKLIVSGDDGCIMIFESSFNFHQLTCTL